MQNTTILLHYTISLFIQKILRFTVLFSLLSSITSSIHPNKFSEIQHVVE